jgi:hypothetical protein
MCEKAYLREEWSLPRLRLLGEGVWPPPHRASVDAHPLRRLRLELLLLVLGEALRILPCGRGKVEMEFVDLDDTTVVWMVQP